MKIYWIVYLYSTPPSRLGYFSFNVRSVHKPQNLLLLFLILREQDLELKTS
jgi:hypothetical protein